MTSPIPPITGTTTVDLPLDQAFEVFTASIDTWWPHEFHIGRADVAEVVLEPGVGGRWYERGVDGTECDWGRVTLWEPPDRVVFTWQIDGSFRFDPDPGRASEIDARFTAVGPAQTVVDVEHRHFDRLVGGQGVSDTINGGGGWALLLAAFAKSAGERG
jgi:uncharacterized protein YndB with AHSA1/START domain